jgi:branched-chain amino acid transport system substrate-binding protein
MQISSFARRGLCALLTTCALALTATSVVAQGKPPLKIGVYLSVTGPAAYLGSGAMKTVEMMVEAANAEGGFDGRKLELYRYDDESDPAKANTLVKRLIENDGVHV